MENFRHTCEINLVLTWYKNCVSVNVTVRDAIVTPTELEVKIKSTRLYVSVVTLSTENNKKTFRAIKTRISKNHINEKLSKN